MLPNAHNTRGEAGGYCARNFGRIGTQCRYQIRFCGGWGCVDNTATYYTAPCTVGRTSGGSGRF